MDLEKYNNSLIKSTKKYNIIKFKLDNGHKNIQNYKHKTIKT